MNIDFKAVYYKNTNKHLLLNNINISIPKGSRIVFAGNNISGKNYIHSLIASELFPSEGEVFINGFSTKLFKKKHKKDFLINSGINFQHSKLINHYSLYYNLILPLLNKRISMSDANKICLEQMAKFNISYLRTLYPKDLSYSEAFLAQMVRAIIHSPELILLENPFDCIDEAAIDNLLEFLNNYSENNTIIISSNHNNNVDRLKDYKIIELVDGIIV